MTKEGHGADSGGDQTIIHASVLPNSHPSISGGGYWPTTMLVNGQSSGVAKEDIVGFFFSIPLVST